MRIVVVFPQPDGPSSTRNSWSAISRLKLSTPTKLPSAPFLGDVLEADFGHLLTRRYPFTAPAVRPDTIWRWKNMTRMKSGTVAETTGQLPRT